MISNLAATKVAAELNYDEIIKLLETHVDQKKKCSCVPTSIIIKISN